MKVLKWIACIIIFVLIYPMIFFALSYLGGIIVQITIGDLICSALNILFDTTRFVPDNIPMICGALAFIGSYFHGVSSSN